MKVNAMIVVMLMAAAEFDQGRERADAGVRWSRSVRMEKYVKPSRSTPSCRPRGSFASIGVQLDWHRASSRFCRQSGDSVIRVTYALHAPADFAPSALAYARPYERVHIEVFCDRIR